MRKFGPGTSANVGVPVNVDVDQRMHLIKAGVNWRFGYGMGPLYAAY
jgi:hypothetical protein